jgi:hypothetical protein
MFSRCRPQPPRQAARARRGTPDTLMQGDVYRHMPLERAVIAAVAGTNVALTDGAGQSGSRHAPACLRQPQWVVHGGGDVASVRYLTGASIAGLDRSHGQHVVVRLRHRLRGRADDGFFDGVDIFLIAAAPVLAARARFGPGSRSTPVVAIYEIARIAGVLKHSNDDRRSMTRPARDPHTPIASLPPLIQRDDFHWPLQSLGGSNRHVSVAPRKRDATEHTMRTGLHR